MVSSFQYVQILNFLVLTLTLVLVNSGNVLDRYEQSQMSYDTLNLIGYSIVGYSIVGCKYKKVIRFLFIE